MSAIKKIALTDNGYSGDESTFSRITQEIEKQGYSIQVNALPDLIVNALLVQQFQLKPDHYSEAGIGRGPKYLKDDFVRTDEISWITGESQAEQLWNDWAAKLQVFLNRRLFLGLFSFESHFAHYAPGDYYKRHYDAFKGSTNRKLSIVTYLNSDWLADQGGELVLYQSQHDQLGHKVLPQVGTVVVFLSEIFPHEVLPAVRDRYSIAGWYRVNTSVNNQVDPPR